MDGNEVDGLLKNYNKEYQNKWEQVRWLGYVTVAVTNDKIKKPEDLLKFKWDKVEKEKVYTQEEKIELQYKLININKNGKV